MNMQHAYSVRELTLEEILLVGGGVCLAGYEQCHMETEPWDGGEHENGSASPETAPEGFSIPSGPPAGVSSNTAG